ncbi:ATPase AAA [[Clostridium] sordellii]|nr:ATPase AAA [[Clostridium] sordellii] [Paeniclostridium sordellii]CEO07777.1 ATPase AAA [[Clostridium] sordellii] [Paeniclostridium sordellii]CEO36012.1 ATPase AAA [[Clostridium] sordellii] [Paeniclostridium sordellii]CEP92485.1 ATPase AAA [[Clostridium] sordellii] [Paeniclostridium sordellii]CEQ06761.1 ATPase AAA [[Clostridium] sordellii] [Paeniclostridium sordellii]
MTYIKQNIIAKEIYEKIVGKYKNVRVLLIEDLFKVSISKSYVNIMFDIVNFRYFNNLPIMISCEIGID